MHIPFDRTRTATALASLVLALGAGQALGAAFILQENSGSGLGNAYAGGAAASEDADTIWTNPAGMSRLKTNQVAAAVNFTTTAARVTPHELPGPLGRHGQTCLPVAAARATQ